MRIIVILLLITMSYSPAMAQEGKLANFIVTPVSGATGGLRETQLQGFRARMERALLATGVFSVESRSQEDADLLFEESRYGGGAPQAGRRADFALKLDIDAFSFEREARGISAMPDKVHAKVIGEVKLRATVLSLHSGEIKKVFTIDQTMEERLGVLDRSELPGSRYEDRNRLVHRLDGSDADFFTLAEAASNMLAERIYEDMFPAEIILVKDDTVYISRGFEAGYAVDEEYRIFSGDGENLYHPQTGELLGTAEVQVADVTIIEARDDFSIGRLGNVTGPVVKGALVRK